MPKSQKNRLKESLSLNGMWRKISIKLCRKLKTFTKTQYALDLHPTFALIMSLPLLSGSMEELLRIL